MECFVWLEDWDLLCWEVPYLKHFSIVPGFWKHLDFKAKVTIYFLCVIVGLLFRKQLIQLKGYLNMNFIGCWFCVVVEQYCFI